MAMPKFTPELFWSRVDKRGPDECWPWTMSTDGRYGRVAWDHWVLKTHRVAWELTYGDVPDDLFVLHHCDNPICCNPAHLFVGTNQDNSDDKVRKGRQRGKARTLTDEQVRYIRRHPEMSAGRVGSDLNISRHTVAAVRRGSCYKDVA